MTHDIDWYREAFLDAHKEAEKLRAELKQALAELGMKTDALNSYAEFYDQAAAACGLVDALPGSATDEIILGRLFAHDQLRERIAELELRLDVGTGNLSDITPFPLIAENARLREALEKAIPIVETFAEENPKWSYMNGPEQDPLGVNATLPSLRAALAGDTQ